MASKRFPIRGGFYALADRHWSQQDVLNLLALPTETGGTKTEYALVQAPGLRPFVEIGADAIRGMRNVEGKLFAVSGQQLYQISNTGVAIPRGTIPGVGRVSMAHNQFGGGNQLLIVNGSAGYVYNTTDLTLTKITDTGYPGAFIVGYVDQYLAQVEPQGRFWFHSDLADATAYNTFDQYEAEADPDRIVSLFVSHREVLLFGKDTIEPFVNTGAQTGTFERASNTVIECGCAAKFSVAGMDNSVFWLDDKRIVRRLDGYTPIRISNAGVEQALAECSPEDIARAYAYTYEDQGFKVYYLHVPGRVTFGFDLRTQEWHRRASPNRDDWRLADLVFWEGQWVGGDRSTGKLYTLDWDYCFDGTEELVREWSSGVLFADQRRIEVNAIEPLVSVGAPTDTADAFPAQPEGPTIDGPSSYLYLVGDAFDLTWTATGGTPPYTYTIAPGFTAPTDATLASSGEMTGTTTAAGSAESRVRVTDANGLWDEMDVAGEVTVEFVLSILSDGSDDGVGVFRTTPTGLEFVSFAKPATTGTLYSAIATTDGAFCVACGSSGLFVFSITAEGVIAYVGPAPVQPGVSVFYGSFAPDDTLFVASFLAASGGHYAKAYTFNPDTGAIALTTLLSPAVAAASRQAVWSPDGTYCCIPINSSTYEFAIYKRTGNALVAVTDPLPGAVTRRSGSCAKWTNDGSKLLVFHESSTDPRAHVFVNNFNDTFTYDGDEFDVFPTSYVRQACFDPSGALMGLAHNGSPYGAVYAYSDGAVGADFTFDQNLPIASGTGQMFAMTFARNGDMLIGGRSGDSLQLWVRDEALDWIQQTEVPDPDGYFIQLNYHLSLCPRAV